MIKIASVTIKDTGFAEYTNAGTAWTKANSGTAITFNTATIGFGIGTANSTNTTIGNWDSGDLYKFAETHKVSVSAPGLTLSIVIDRRDSTQMGYIPRIIELARSKGYKILYYNDTDETREAQELLYQLTKIGVGATAVGTEHIDTGSQYSTEETTYPHIHVRINGSISIKQVPKSKLIGISIPLVMQK